MGAERGAPPRAAARPDDLMGAARAARGRAYAPYSRFPVGAAVETDAGVFAGANVENASYPVGLCAERAALGAAVSAGARRLLAVAVAGSSRLPTPPCGFCRQFLAEFDPEGAAPVACEGTDASSQRTWALRDLLPEAFGRAMLKES